MVNRTISTMWPRSKYFSNYPNWKQYFLQLELRMSDYDESCYPGPAEPDDSDDEASPREQTSLSMDSGPPPDFTCSVCSDILLDPVSLHCGHTFCQLCLAGVWQSSGRLPAARLVCPVCRLPWRNFPGVNITLRYVYVVSLHLLVVVCIRCGEGTL